MTYFQKLKMFVLLFSFVGIPLTFLGVGIYMQYFQVEENMIVTVKEKTVKRAGDSDMYLVVVEHPNGKREVLKNTDSILRWKWNSSDIYADLDEGKKYKLEVCGMRVQQFSMYRNILKAYRY